MAYHYLLNQTPATGAVAMYDWLTNVVAAGWTVQKWSDGTTYHATGPGAGQTGFTSGASGADGLDNASAWMVVQQPAGGSAPFTGTRQICLQRNSSTGANTARSWKIKYDVNTGFTGGSPGATRVPSATGEQTFYGGGTDAAPTFSVVFGNNDGGHRYNCVANDASPFSFWCGGWPNGGGSPSHAWLFDGLTGYLAGDTEPYVMYVDGTTSANATWSGDITFEAAFTGNIASHFLFGLGGTGYVKTLGQVLQDYTAPTTSVPTMTFAGGVNPINGKDLLWPCFYGRRYALTLPRGYKGRSSMILWSGADRSLRTTGDLFTVSASGDHILLGDSVLPWQSGTAPVL